MLLEETKASNGSFPGLRRPGRDLGESRTASRVMHLLVIVILMMVPMCRCFRIYKPALDVHVDVSIAFLAAATKAA